MLHFLTILLAVFLVVHTSSALSYPTPSSTCHRGSNRLFLDTADVSIWEELLPLGIFHGVTCNPTLLERASQACTVANLHVLARTCLVMPFCQEFMCQSWGATCDEMYETGLQLSQPDRQRIVIKVPVTAEGTKAAALLIDSGVRVCLTACYDQKQAIVAAGLGAEYLAPYLGRMTDAGKDGLDECRQMEYIARGMGSTTRILVASIRDVQSMADLMEDGMDTFTFNPDVARQLFSEPLTEEAANEFEKAAERGASSK